MEAQYRLELLGQTVHGANGESAIVEALQDEDLAVRDHAISLAVRHLEPEVLGELIADDENAILRNAALQALERQGFYALPFLREMSLGPNAEVAMFSLQALARIPDPDSIPYLTRLLDHDDENVKLAAIEALGTHRSRRTVPRLCEMMCGSFWQQFGVMRSLGQIGDPRAIPTILDAMNNEMLLEPAVEALGGIATTDCLPPLWSLLAECDEAPVRVKILRAIAATLDKFPGYSFKIKNGEHDANLQEYLAETLESTDTELARAAATVAILRRCEELYPRIIVRAVDSDERVWIGNLFQRFPVEFGRALPALLSHEDPKVRQGAFEAGPIGELPVSLPLRRLRDNDHRVRAAACRALGKCGMVDAIPEMIQQLLSVDTDVRAAAIEGLSQMPPNRLQPLARCLSSNRPDEIITAALAVVETSSCNLLAGEVVRLLNADRPGIRRAALRAAAALSGVDTEKDLLASLDDPDESVRIEAIDVLVNRGCRIFIPRLLSLLAHESPVRYYAIQALGRLGVERAAKPLKRLFPRAKAHEQIEIVSALIRIEPNWIVRFLKKQFENGNIEIRRIAAEGLVRIPEALDLAGLKEMASDEDWSVRSFAAWGLGRLASPEARVPLLDLCRDLEPLVARIARDALGRTRE